MESFLNAIKIAKKNKGLLYYYEGNGYVYSPCKDLYGAPVVNFREKTKGGDEKYGTIELSKEDRELMYKKRLKNKI